MGPTQGWGLVSRRANPVVRVMDHFLPGPLGRGEGLESDPVTKASDPISHAYIMKPSSTHKDGLRELLGW